LVLGDGLGEERGLLTGYSRGATENAGVTHDSILIFEKNNRIIYLTWGEWVFIFDAGLLMWDL